MLRFAKTYGLTLAAVAVAWLARWLLDPVLGDNLPNYTFFFAVLFAAWYGGFKPGMLAWALGLMVGDYFFTAPRFTLDFGTLLTRIEGLRFFAVALFVSVVCEQLHRRRREAEARSEQLRVTLASIGDAVIATDGEGRVTYLNQVAESLTGWSPAEALGRPLAEVFRIVDEETHQPVENPAAKALREGVVSVANHTVLLGRDGGERPVDDSAAPIRDPRGQVTGCVLIFRDISERRQTERRIYELMIELRRADRRKDVFLATLAHELRNPLAPIRNVLEVFKLPQADAKALQGAREVMERQFGQLVRLVDDLLDVSRITQGKLELRPLHVELASVIYQAVEASLPLAESAGHEVLVDLPSQPIYLVADPVRLAQVFGNLINNSCRYSEPGGKVRITAERQDGHVLVAIRDNGAGIPADRLETIFEMFAQVDQPPEQPQGGLGIGLKLVKQLVQMHGGSVEARSEGQGKGSEFVVRLPVFTERPGPKPPAPKPPPERLPGRRILVVDDNRDSAESLALLLTLTGHDTHTAHDGPEALEAAERLRPDAILLDIGLPGLSGHDVCRRLREQPWGQEIVIVALTGWGQEEDRRRSHEADFDGHLVKPVDYPTLLKALAAGRRAAD